MDDEYTLPASFPADPPTQPPTPPTPREPSTPHEDSTTARLAASVHAAAAAAAAAGGSSRGSLASGVSGRTGGENGEEPAGDPEATNVVPSQHKSQFLQFLATLASFTGDLSQLTCPAFLLSGMSLLEYSVHWCDHPDLFTAIPRTTDPFDRMLQVTQWFLSTLYGAYHSRCKDGTEKKPYNPILGETFHCTWPEDGLAMTCEQVSHHPPVSAFHLADHPTQPTITLDGHCGQKTKFKTTYLKVTQEGRAHLRVFRDGRLVDTYLLTLPSMAVRGLLSGNIFVDLEYTCVLLSDSGYLACVQFLPKPWFSGAYHQVKTQILRVESAEVVAEMQGNWTQRIVRVDREGAVVVDNAVSVPRPPTVRPVEAQGEMESRKVWHKCTEALLARHFSAATREKTVVEEAQRALRREREAAQTVWTPRHFRLRTDLDTDLVHRLRAYCAANPRTMDATTLELALGGGVWVYEAETGDGP